MSKPSESRWIPAILVAGAAVHVLAAVAVWLLARKTGGLLPNSDEAYIVSKAGAIVAGWLEGRVVQWRDISVAETNPGYYYLVALVRRFLTDELLALRLMNSGLGLAAIATWYAVLRRAGDARSAGIAFLVVAVWIPSPALWSALILKEAAMYLLVALHVLAVTRLMRGTVTQWTDLALYAATILLLSAFRNYVAFVALALSVPLLCYVRGAWSGVLAFLLALGATLLLNPYALTLFAYKATGGWISVHAVDWFLGQSELLAMGPPRTGSGDWTVEAISAGTSTGAAAIPPGTPVWVKAWLFLSFPLPWQASSLLQAVASPEAVLILLSLPVVVAGMVLRLRQRDPVAFYVVLLMAALAAIYVTFVNNQGTLYRIKSSLLLPALYFAIPGGDWLAGRLRRRAAA